MLFYCAIFLFVTVVNCKENEEVKVDVYYESLCPDSKQFITRELFPILDKDISKRIELNIYPYGKSTTRKSEDKYSFVCHHGEFECVGNKYHGCALRLIENGKSSENLSFNKNALNYINCMMENIYFDDKHKRRAPVDKCKETLGKHKEEVEKCAQNQQGDEFLAEYGKLTDAFQKPLKSVPTIVFNGKYDAKESQEAYVNFLKVLCGKFKGNTPKDCNEKEEKKP